MKTFVAPCHGGPLDGKLRRVDWGCKTFVVPVMQVVMDSGNLKGNQFVYHLYHIAENADGSHYWKYQA